MQQLQTRRWIMGSGLAAVMGIAAFSQMAATAGPAGKGIAWKGSWQQAQQEARRTGKPILVDFHATWCGACKLLDAQTLSKPLVVRAARKWVAVQVDVDKTPEVAQKYGVRVLPTIAFLRPNGTLVTSFYGFREAGATAQLMQAAYGKAKK